MKKCPCCGYLPTPTNRQMMNQYDKRFGDGKLVMQMINRGWLDLPNEADMYDLAKVEAALCKFWEVDSLAERDAKLEKFPEGCFGEPPAKRPTRKKKQL
jgi:hypothetical protein